MDTDTITAPTTAEVLANMLTENTGRSLCDSGGAYGRNWERNQGATVETFKARPEIDPCIFAKQGEVGTIEYVSIDVFHFLNDRLDYDLEMDAQFHAFAEQPEYEHEGWLTIAEAWLSEIGATWGGGDGWLGFVNTYNGEDLLSQVIQYALWENEETGDTMAILQIHGGCDVRGGYTAPRVFSLGSYAEYSLFDNARVTAILTEPDLSEPFQGVIFTEHPNKAGGRSIVIDYDGGDVNRETHPYDDSSLDGIDFAFGETPVVAQEDGSFVIADGPAQGWTLKFYPWPAG